MKIDFFYKMTFDLALITDEEIKLSRLLGHQSS